MCQLLKFPHKHIRALAIKDYLSNMNYDGVVCFTCGNAAKELKNVGVNTISVGGSEGDLLPNRWFSQKDIHNTFSNVFDATSGHLPMELMVEIGKCYRDYLGELDNVVYVPCGSGETLVCLKLAYPNTDFIAVYNLNAATKYEPDCVLNPLVKLLAKEIVLEGGGVDYENL